MCKQHVGLKNDKQIKHSHLWDVVVLDGGHSNQLRRYVEACAATLDFIMKVSGMDALLLQPCSHNQQAVLCLEEQAMRRSHCVFLSHGAEHCF